MEHERKISIFDKTVYIYIYIYTVYIYIPSGPQVSARGGVGWGGVGWGMSTSCRSYVDVTLMGWGGVGWGTVLAALKQFRELPMSSLQPTSKVWDAAPWKL